MHAQCGGGTSLEERAGRARAQVPCAQELYEEEGNLQVLVTTFWRLPLIFLAMIAVRFMCIAAFNPLFRLAKSGALQ